MLRPDGYDRYIIFHFDAHGNQSTDVNKEWYLCIWVDSYEPTHDPAHPKMRSLGSSPVLRRSVSGHILTTSLEWDAQCDVDGEFAELYTCDPTAYLVTLEDGSGTIHWYGFIVPELYSASYVNAPYDVHLTASDNLTELKRARYTDTSRRSFTEHLRKLLNKTGLQATAADIYARCTIRETVRNVGLWGCYATLGTADEDEAPTYWDVLEGILAICDGYIFQHEGRWLIMGDEKRTPDEVSYGSVDFVSLGNGAPLYYNIEPIRKQQYRTWLPVGYLTDTIEPARRRVSVTAAFAKPRNIVEVEGEYESQWSEDYGAWWLRSTPTQPLLVARSDNGDRGYTPYLVRLVVTPYAYAGGGEVSDSKVRLHLNLRSISGSVTRYYNFNKLRWQTTQPAVKHYDLDCDTWDPEESGALPEAQTIEVQLPFFPGGVADLSIVLDSYDNNTEFGLFVHEISFSPVMAFDGWQNSYALGNNAREDADEVRLGAVDFPSTLTSCWKDCVPNGISTTEGMATSATVTRTWRNDATGATGSLVNVAALTHCAAVGLPRIRRTGTLMTTTPYRIKPPLVVSDGIGGTAYFVRSFAWDIIESTVEIDAITFPTATISGVTPSEKKIKNRLK